MQITIKRTLPYPKSVVWSEISKIERHVLWMGDAERIDFISDSRTGKATEFNCITKVGPIRVTDRMKVTGWEEPNQITVAHKGLFKGEGTLSLKHLSPEFCEITWSEHITFPPLFLGPIGAQVAKPILEKIWGNNLKQLEALLETSS
jgi:hypothetical protein